MALFVTAEEFSQILLKYRGFSLTDLLADYAGILCFGQLAAYLTHRMAARDADSRPLCEHMEE